MIIVIHTQAGSTYEIDDAEMRVRRVAPHGAAHEHRNEWRSFAYRSLLTVGKSAMFAWERQTPFDEEGHCTTTSRVTAIVTTVVPGDGS